MAGVLNQVGSLFRALAVEYLFQIYIVAFGFLCFGVWIYFDSLIATGIAACSGILLGGSLYGWLKSVGTESSVKE